MKIRNCRGTPCHEKSPYHHIAIHLKKGMAHHHHHNHPPEEGDGYSSSSSSRLPANVDAHARWGVNSAKSSTERQATYHHRHPPEEGDVSSSSSPSTWRRGWFFIINLPHHPHHNHPPEEGDGYSSSSPIITSPHHLRRRGKTLRRPRRNISMGRFYKTSPTWSIAVGVYLFS